MDRLAVTQPRDILPVIMTPSRRTRKMVLVACVLVYAAGILSVGAYRAREDQSSTSDFDDFYLTARRFLDTGDVVRDYGVHNYPPFAILFFVPFGLVPIKVASALFNGLALAGFVLSVRLVDRWAAEEAGPLPRKADEIARAAGPIGMVLAYVTGCLIMGQMALFTLAMLVLGLHYIEKRRDVPAAFWLAVAISTKVYPVLLLPWLVLKRKWRLSAVAAGMLVVMNVLLPILAMGPTRAGQLYRGFYRDSIRGQSALRLAVIESNKMSHTNQSSALVARRYTRPTDSGVDGADGRPRMINLVDWDDTPIGIGPLRLARVQWLLAAAFAALVGATGWVCRHPARSVSMSRMRYEYATVILLSLLLTPISWSFYYCLCYLPLALINARVLAAWRGRRRAAFAWAAVAAWWLAVPAMASPTLRMCGFHLMATFILFVATCAAARGDAPRAASGKII